MSLGKEASKHTARVGIQKVEITHTIIIRILLQFLNATNYAICFFELFCTRLLIQLIQMNK
jgi:hypothetical protein